ncbi:MAG: hypothetical protein HOV94_32965, partial [Saccharothrix sp.]|nr:hypothetical protein [Saccharothrix sp.]
MSRRTTVAVCLAFGLLAVPGVALADPPWLAPVDRADGIRAAEAGLDRIRGDVCEYRGDLPCYGTTTVTSSYVHVDPTPTPETTTDVSGTSETSSTTTTTDVAGTTAASTTSTAPE